MTSGMGQLNEQVRRVAREEAARTSPPLRKFRVVKLTPFTIEALGSDARLTADDDDFEIAATIRDDSKVGDTIVVGTNATGEHVALGRTVPETQADRGLTAEKKDREDADKEEALARAVADSAEKTARESADGGEKAARESAVNAEKEAREAAVAAAAAAAGKPTLILARAATTAALPANTLTGTVLEANANGALGAQDGVSLSVGDRLLNWKEAESSAKHGVFEVTSLGSAGSKWKLTRISAMDESAEVIGGMQVNVLQGTQWGGVSLRLLTTGAIVLGTTALTFGYASAWTAAPFTANWKNYESGAFLAPAYRKSPDGKVHLRGLAQPTAIGQNTLFTLPTGFRPSLEAGFSCAGSFAPGATCFRMDVRANGEVWPEVSFAGVTGGFYVFLDTISFYAD